MRVSSISSTLRTATSDTHEGQHRWRFEYNLRFDAQEAASSSRPTSSVLGTANGTRKAGQNQAARRVRPVERYGEEEAQR